MSDESIIAFLPSIQNEHINNTGFSNLPTQLNSPELSPTINLKDSSTTYGRKVLQIDPKLASDKLRELANNTSMGLLSPSYSYSPGRSRPPLGSILQTPPDLTPTYIDRPLRQEFIEPAHSPEITKSINDFLQNLPTSIIEPEVSKEDKIQNARRKADYRVKFSILREAYPQMNIPEPGENESIEEIEAGYKEYVKKIHVESSVEQNKVYLLILWIIIDVAGTRLLRLPFHGRYLKSQFKYMQKYQMLLIELGERSYVEDSVEGWSVELRLLAMAIFHGVIFALVTLLASRLGGGNAANDKMADELREIIDNFLTQNKGADVLRRAEQATTDNPLPQSATQNASPPLGDLGSVISNLAPMFMNMFTGGGGGDQEAVAPQEKRPTTFGSRHRRAQPDLVDDI